MPSETWRIRNHDKMCAYRRKWYRSNSKSVKRRSKDRREFFLEWLLEIKSHSRCELCQEDVQCCLDLHHDQKDQKVDVISRIIYDSCSLGKTIDEFLKCAILCSNCHRKIHNNIVNVRLHKIEKKLIDYTFRLVCDNRRKNNKYVPPFHDDIDRIIFTAVSGS
jgi:hypothetical protein